MKRIDHAEAASEFIAARAQQEFHDRRLWDLRLKRDREACVIPEWGELRLPRARTFRRDSADTRGSQGAKQYL